MFKRLWKAIKAHINAFLDKMEDPEQALEQSIREMQKQVNRLRGDVIKVVAEEKKLKNQVDKHHKDVERWEKNAMLAIKEGNETLAREALKRKREAVQYTQQLQPQWEQQEKLASRLKDEFHGLREKIQSAQHRKRNLVTRLRHAESQKRLQGLLNDLSDTQVFEKFETKVLDTEVMVEAQAELQESSLEEKFKALESGGDMGVDQELQALKERMQLNP